MAREFIISADNDGRRVDRVLRTLWPGVPLGAIMKAIRTGEVRLDGKRTKGEARLAEGQRLTVPCFKKFYKFLLIFFFFFSKFNFIMSNHSSYIFIR